MKHICPPRLNEYPVTSFLTKLFACRSFHEAVIDFSPITFAAPFGTLLLAEGLRQFVRDRHNNSLATRAADEDAIINPKTQAISYLKHVGFFQFIGLPHGNQPNAGMGSATYFPITTISREEFTQGVVIQDYIDRRSDRLAELIFEDSMQRLMLSYCFREVIRNVFEHANVGYCTVMAQKWQNLVEIGIIDVGRGILASLAESHPVQSPREAIQSALQPGVSRVIESGNDKWANSGFGLYVLSQLGQRLGEFSIISSGLAVKSSAKFDRSVPIAGTAVRLKVDTNSAEFFPNVLKQIVDEGERVHFERTGTRKTASKSSGLW